MAACLTTAAFVPQVYKTWRTRDVQGISLTMYLAFFIGVLLWFIYGWYIDSLSILLANGITAILVLVQLILRIRYRIKR